MLSLDREVMEIKKNTLLLFFVLSLFLMIKTVFAHCPLCVAATASMVATARFYGVDDLITGTLVGGLVVSSAAWINRLLKKRNKGRYYIPFQSSVLTIIWLSLFVIIFFVAKLISFKLFDRLLIGILMGTFITSIAFRFQDFLKETNGKKNYIPFQVIFVTIAFLLITVFGYYVVGVIG